VYESATIGANAEMRWEVMKDKGYLVPAENFYVRDHTSTPLIDARTWQLKVFGSGLRGAPGIGSAVTFSYEDLLGMPLLPDHGFPLRFICPSWIGVANVKWVGQIEVSATPLFSYWNTLAYRLFGPTYPAAGTLITRQVVKSSFELEWNATLPARPSLLTGRSWSGNGRIAYTEVSTDGPTWQRARPRDRGLPHAWQRWEIPWQPPGPGAYTLRARATDVTGATQPATVPFNTREYLFDGIVDHHVTVT
jgi:DMSO/TMAO reductase YedYZ molybdopterin-dependent catalytic subunit